MEGAERGIKESRGREIKRKRESLNWESITEAWVGQPFSVSRKHTEMCSSAQAL